MKKCLFCKTVYLDEFDKCPNCARVSHKIYAQENAQKQEEIPNQQQKQTEQIDLTKIPQIKNPNVFLVLGIILCVFLALSALCFII